MLSVSAPYYMDFAGDIGDKLCVVFVMASSRSASDDVTSEWQWESFDHLWFAAYR